MAQQSIEEILGLPAGGADLEPEGEASQTIDELLGLKNGKAPLPKGAEWSSAKEAVNAGLLGFGPEIAAGGYALSHAQQAGGLGQAYSEGLKTINQARGQYMDENPLAGGAIDLAGSAPTVALASMLTPAMPYAGAFAVGSRMGQGASGALFRGLQSATRGAMLGGQAGALESKLTGGSLGENVVQGAELGAGLNLAGKGLKAVMGPRASAATALPIRHGRWTHGLFAGGAAGALAGGMAERAAEYGVHAASSLASSPGTAAAAGVAALAAATGYAAVRAVRNAARREAHGLSPTDWDRMLEGMSRGAGVNVLGGAQTTSSPPSRP